MVPMDTSTRADTRRDYLARLRGGPDDGALIRVAALPGGSPPDFFHAGPDDPGLYALAGLPHADGSIPYWWVPNRPRPPDPSRLGESTWTLLSATGGGRTLRVWHQHGAGSKPVQLYAQEVTSTRVRTLAGRTFVCPECEDMTVIGLPDEQPH